jgi:hypothetical protein
VTAVDVATSFARYLHASRINERAVDYLRNSNNLDAATVNPREDAAYVTVPDLDALNVWRDLLGGMVRVGPACDGFRTVILHASYLWLGVEVTIRVATTVWEDEPGLSWYRAGVAA